MNLNEEYIKRMKEQNPKYEWLFNNTTVTWIEPLESGGMSFRFETTVRPYQFPICQYVVYKKGRFEYRPNGRWFIPGDFLFDDFKSALDTLKQIRQMAERMTS